jgi:PAS domain S-box-containing protein
MKHISTDASSLQKENQALKKELDVLKQHKNLIIDSSQQIVYEYDILSGKIIWEGDTIGILGYTIEEMGDINTWEKMIHPNDKNEVITLINKCIANLDVFNIEYRFKKKNGQFIYILDKGHIIPNSLGKAQTMLGMMHNVNKHRITEKALQLSEDKYKNLFENSVLGMFLTTFEGKILMANPALIKMLGYNSFKDIEKLDIPNVGYAERKTRQKFINKFKNADELFGFESLWRKKDGSTLNVRENAKAIRDENGNILFFEGNVENITKQKRIESELHKSENQYKAIFDNVSDAILIIEQATFNIIAANDAAFEIYNYSKNELINLNLKEIVADAEFEIQQINDLIEKTYIKNYETLHYNKNKKEINFLANGSLISYDGKNAILITYHEITEIKKSQKIQSAIYRISQLTHTAIDRDDLYRSIHNIIGELMNANNFYIAIHDEPTQLISFPYFVDEYDFPPKPRKYHKGLTEYILNKGKPLHAGKKTMEALKQKGEVEFFGSTPVEWLGVPLITNGKGFGILAIQSYSEKVKYSKDELEMLVFVSEQIATSIYRKQTEEEIIKAKAKAEESDNLKSAMLSNINHEIRTPMTGILGFSEILFDSASDFETKAIAQNIFDSAKRLMNTLNSIIDLSQLIADKTPVKLASSNINSLILSVSKNFEEFAQRKNLEIKYNLTKDIHAFVDEYLFKQVIFNLVDNAVKFSEEGEICITTEYTEENSEKFVLIKVKDEGIGIDKAHHSYVFEEFRQVSEGISRSFEGTGLGLSISKKMIEIMNGSISLESQIGKGAEFTIKFSISTINDIKEVSEKNSIAKKSDDKIVFKLSSYKKLPNILLVEDNKINVDLIVVYLKNICNITYTMDGYSAIKLAKENYYDAIIMDINLGIGIDGLETAKEIRKMEQYSNTPIIALTGYTTFYDRKKLLQEGCSHYMAKPFNSNDITNLVKEVLSESLNKK